MKLGKIDLSQIECRILNTIAGQHDIVRKFRDGVDLYSELATQFYGFPVDKSKPAERGTGKQLELSCGYGASGPTIVRTARSETYGPPVYLTDERGLEARDLYRRTHPAVVNLWDTGKVALQVLHSGQDWNWPGVPCLTVHDHRIFGPDGLWLDYSSLEYTESMEWRHRVRSGYRKTYGARLIENIVQFLASIPIRRALVYGAELGLRMPLTVHDDVFCLTEDSEQG